MFSYIIKGFGLNVIEKREVLEDRSELGRCDVTVKRNPRILYQM